MDRRIDQEGRGGVRRVSELRTLGGSEERIEPRHNSIPQEKHIPIPSPPVRLHRNNIPFFRPIGIGSRPFTGG